MITVERAVRVAAPAERVWKLFATEDGQRRAEEGFVTSIEFEGKGHRRNGKVLPIDERFVNHWNHDPWRLDEGGGGTEMADGVAFLLPYWMGVYHGFVKELSSPAAQ